MKKKSFLSGVSAKLALAAVALTTVMFTSCEKEEFNVAPVEQADASATIAITVYDLSDGSIITDANVTENGASVSPTIEIKAGSDGKIAAATRTFAATKDGYLAGEGQAVVPALNKGQFALIPVSIYLQKEADAAKDVTVTPDPDKTASETTPTVEGGSYENTSSDPVEKELSYTAYVGQEVTNLTEVEAWIDANVPVTKALTNDEVKAVLKAAVAARNTGITAVTKTEKVTVPAHKRVTLKATTEYETSVNELSATVEGEVYRIPNVKIKKALNTTATPEEVSIEHGHGHGNDNGAGGGDGDGTAY